MKNLADGTGHIINAAASFFRREEPERRVALWIQVDDEDPLVVICSEASTDMDRIRGLTNASLEIDKRDYLAHPGICSEFTAKQIQYLGARKKRRSHRRSTKKR